LRDVRRRRKAGIFPAKERAVPVLSSLPVPVVTIGLLIASNIFMTFAWYGHLKFKTAPLVLVILISWGIAFFEYVLQVPANRIGHGHFSAAELKTIQEVISLTVFAAFSVLYLGERLAWNHLAGFALIAAGAFLVFQRASPA
jgi:uncharacterized protein (DUF486 family)